MLRKISLLLIAAFSISFCSCQNTKEPVNGSILKIEMSQSAFGVEADDIPTIKACIDFTNDSSRCERSFYNPAYKGSVYSLSKAETEAVLNLLNNTDLVQLKPDYSVSRSDQPRGQTTIYTTTQTFVINDYGMEGEDVLKKLYKIVYRWGEPRQKPTTD